jgi:hypothetical protein
MSDRAITSGTSISNPCGFVHWNFVTAPFTVSVRVIEHGEGMMGQPACGQEHEQAHGAGPDCCKSHSLSPFSARRIIGSLLP